jgi:uncharacterized membrane protein YjjB (DUF3815 family)
VIGVQQTTPKSGTTVISGVFAVSFLIGFCSHLYADGLLRERRVYIGRYLDKALDDDFL